MSRLTALFRGRSSVSPRTTQIGPVGMEFAQDELRMIQLVMRADGKIAVNGHCKCPYPNGRKSLFESPGALRKLLKHAFKSSSFSGKQIVTALPPEEVKIMPLAYPNSSKGDDQTIASLLEKRVEGDLREFVVDYLPIRSNPGDEEKLALVVMAKRDRVEQILDRLWDAGMEVEAIDVGPAAINRVFSAASGAENADTTLIINSGRDRSYLTMISGRRLLLDQQVAFGELPLLRHLSQVLDIEQELGRQLLLNHGFNAPPSGDADALPSLQPQDISGTLQEILKPLFLKLVEEINRVLLFSASETRGNPVKQVYLLGAVAHWKGADRLLDSLLEIPVVPINKDLQVLKHRLLGEEDSRLNGFSPDMVIATGLALRGFDADA